MKRLSAKGFWGCTALVLVLLFLIDRHYFVMPDALSVAVGGLIGTYLISWLIWQLVRWRMKDRAPDSRYFVVALSAVLLTVTNGGHILGLLH